MIGRVVIESEKKVCFLLNKINVVITYTNACIPNKSPEKNTSTIVPQKSESQRHLFKDF